MFRAPRWFALALVLALEVVDARMLAPLRKSTALKLLRRLAEGSDDEISIDIGGTLAKVMLFQRLTDAPPEDGKPPSLDLGEICSDPAFGDPDQQALSVYSPELGGNLHFFVFETRAMTDVINFVRRYYPEAVQGVDLESGSKKHIQLRATGGGSYKHADSLRMAGIHLDLEEEMSAIIAGLDFLTRRCPGELFTVDSDALGLWSPMATPAQNAELASRYVSIPQPPSDYLYVSIGSGVSMMEVHSGSPDDATRYRRVGGSSVGGSTFWGLVRLLTSCSVRAAPQPMLSSRSRVAGWLSTSSGLRCTPPPPPPSPPR